MNTQIGNAVIDSTEAAEAFITDYLIWKPADVCNFAVEFNGGAVGNVGLSNIDTRHRTGWMSYWISSSARGQGLAERAAASVAEWAFEELDLFRLELGHRTNNPASCKVASRAGFIPEGIERSKLQYGDERFDVETHARLATDSIPETELIHLNVPASAQNNR